MTCYLCMHGPNAAQRKQVGYQDAFHKLCPAFLRSKQRFGSTTLTLLVAIKRPLLRDFRLAAAASGVGNTGPQPDSSFVTVWPCVT